MMQKKKIHYAGKKKKTTFVCQSEERESVCLQVMNMLVHIILH